MLPSEILPALEDTLQRLVKDYQDLNPRFIQAIDHTPSAVEFSKFVTANRPLVFRGQGHREEIAALYRWSNSYLVEKLGGRRVAIAVSPDGRADSIIDGNFVEPASVDMSLEDLFASLNPKRTEINIPPPAVHYLQSQNGNLAESGELHPLLEDVGEGPEWAREVFGQKAFSSSRTFQLFIRKPTGEPPDVANSPDPYENIYLVIRGTKTFTLLPPTEFYCLHEREFPSAHYTHTPPSTFELAPSSPPFSVPWIPVDPTSPDLSLYPRFAYAKPLTITLEAGDMLYLPALWFHRVAQDVGPSPAGAAEEPAAIAANWWYDMSMNAPLWSTAAFVRRTTMLLDGRVEPNLDED
ncbi:peptidyl-lysine (3S)-dioxygenase / protease, partial [Phenoliferia sp. Uapishka_3]